MTIKHPDFKEWYSFLAWTILLMLSIITGLLIIESIENSRFRENQRRSVVEQLGTIRARLEGQLNRELLLAQSIIVEVESNTDISEIKFSQIARHFLRESKHIRNIGLAKGTVLKYVYPIKGNEKAIGIDYKKMPSQWPSVQRVILGRKTVVAGPVNLVQGGVGIISRTPIFIDKDNDGSNTGYFGLLSVVINLWTLFDAAGLNEKPSFLKITIRGKDGLGSDGDVFYGSEALLTDNPVTMAVTLPGGSWQLLSIPVDGWTTKSPSIIYYRMAATIAGLVILFQLVLRQGEMRRRKAAQRTIVEKERFLNTLLNAIPLPVFYKDRAGIYRGFNDAYEAFMGKSKTQLIGKSVFDISPEELARIYHAKDNELFESGGTQHYESRVKNARNEIRDVLFDKSVYTDSNGTMAGLIGTVSDITERKQMEEALRQSEERFREMAELLPGAIVEIDIDLNVTYVNRHGLTLFGYSEKDFAAGANGLDLIHPDDREKALERLADRLENKTVSAAEYRVIKKGKESCWVFSNASTIYKDDEITGFRMVLTDITQRKQIEKEREELIEKLQKALAKIKTLRGIVPICANCKKIRDDEGYWNILESYIQEHSDASFSHSICPECSDKLYGDQNWYQKKFEEE